MPRRLTRSQLSIVAALSVTATVLVIVAASGPTAAQTAALAALHRRSVVLSGSGTSPATGSTPASLTAGASAPPDAGAPAASQPSDTAASSTPADPAPSDSGGQTTTETTTTPTPKSSGPRADHVFVIALSSTSWDATFGPSSVAHYLNGTLKREGTELGGYQSLGATGLPDYLAMVSGQPPNADTRAGCSVYAEFPAGTTAAANGTVAGDGCVYPNTVLTIGDQATAAGKQWRAYVDGIESTPCPHPNSNAVDEGVLAGTGVDYSDRHNPFVYFHSLLDLGGCASNDVSLSKLHGDLADAKTAPAFAYIAPDACDEANVTTCSAGGATGIAAEDSFLRKWVPVITRSAAYKQGGALVIAFAPPVAASAGGTTSSAAIPTGALVLSPHTPHGQVVSAVYDPYSVLRTVEDLLGYKPLGLAAKAKSFAGKTFGGS